MDGTEALVDEAGGRGGFVRETLIGPARNVGMSLAVDFVSLVSYGRSTTRNRQNSGVKKPSTSTSFFDAIRGGVRVRSRSHGGSRGGYGGTIGTAAVRQF